jgi:hypothetical protein
MKLLDAKAIEHADDGYRLTEAGTDLMGVIRELGTWGQKWLPRAIADDELDVDALLWDMHRRVAVDRLPPRAARGRPGAAGASVSRLVPSLPARRGPADGAGAGAGAGSALALKPGFGEGIHDGHDLR